MTRTEQETQIRSQTYKVCSDYLVTAEILSSEEAQARGIKSLGTIHTIPCRLYHIVDATVRHYFHPHQITLDGREEAIHHAALTLEEMKINLDWQR